MKTTRWIRRIIPAGLGATMLAVVISAALTPNFGVISAQVNLQYSQYGSGTPAVSSLEYALIGVLVAAMVIALVLLLIFRRRKKGGPGDGAEGAAALEQPQGGAPSDGAEGAPAPEQPPAGEAGEDSSVP